MTIAGEPPLPDADADPEPPEKARRASLKQVVRGVFSLAVVLVIFFGVLPQITDFGDVWRQIQAMSPYELATLGLAAAWNLLTYLFVIVPSSPGITYPQAFVMTQATTAVSNTFPAGAAVGIGMTYAMYSSWGFTRSEGALAILVSGIWNNFMKLGLPVVALVLLALSGTVTPGRITAGLAGIGALVGAIALFALLLRSDELARRVGNGLGRLVSGLRRLVRRPPTTGWGDSAVRFRDLTIRLVRRSWLRLTVGAVVSHLSLYLVLLLTLRDVGVSERQVGWIEVLAAFAFIRLLSALPITPGGVGVVELGLIAALVAAGGNRPKVVAAVLVYRTLTYLLPIPFGVVTYVIWRRKSSWRKEPPPEPASPLPGEADPAPTTSDRS